MIRNHPLLQYDVVRAGEILAKRALRRISWQRANKLGHQGQFKSPGQGMGGRGGKFGRQQSYPGTPQSYPYSPGFSARSPMPMGHRGMDGTPQSYPYSPGFSARSPMPMGHRGMDGSESYYHGDESYDYQQGASDDSRDTQLSGDMSHQMAFGSDYGDGSSQQGYDQSEDSSTYAAHVKTQPVESNAGSIQDASGGTGNKSPPDIKYEVTPVPFIKSDDFELIEIDPDEEDDL